MSVNLLSLNYRRRIRTVLWVTRLLQLACLAAFALAVFKYKTPYGYTRLFIAIAVFCFLAQVPMQAWAASLRRQFIRNAEFPRFLVNKIVAAHPELKARDADLVLRGLRQFFIAHLSSKRQFVAMPSKVVDTAWHEYILHTRGYALWCEAAFGGMLHHTPAEVLGRSSQRNDGLRRVWYWACKEESINPRKPSRLPLLVCFRRQIWHCWRIYLRARL